jgi:tetratricopeptide (TPR) repeat protein
MTEDFDPFSHDVNDLVGKFDEMIRQNKMYFFDVEEFEEIIDFYLEQNITKKARKAIDYAMRQHPSSTVFMLRKAQYYADVNNTTKALDILHKIEVLEPQNPEILATKGAVYSQLKQYKEAISEYEKAIRYSDEKDDLYTRIAFEYEEIKEYNQAIEYLVKALEFNPENQAVIYELAFCYELAGREDEGIAFFGDFLDKNPYSDIAWFNLGIAYSNKQLYEKAIDAYEFVIAISPDFSSAYFNKANALANLERYQEAIGYYQETLEMEAPDGMTHYYIGECYEKLDDLENAYSNYHIAARLEPEVSDIWAGLAIISDRTSNGKAALKYIRKALSVEETNMDFKLILADMCFRYGKLDEAISIYHEAILREAGHPDVWLEFSGMWYNLENLNEAIGTIMRGIEAQPTNADQYYRLAGYLAAKGRTKEAYQNFETALYMDATGYELFLEFFPEHKNDVQFYNLIDQYKKNRGA